MSRSASWLSFRTKHPRGEARQEAARRLKEHLGQVDEKLQGIAGQEIEEALNEALQAVRPAYRERE